MLILEYLGREASIILGPLFSIMRKNAWYDLRESKISSCFLKVAAKYS